MSKKRKPKRHYSDRMRALEAKVAKLTNHIDRLENRIDGHDNVARRHNTAIKELEAAQATSPLGDPVEVDYGE